LLKLFIALGCAAGLANAAQAVTTLQLNFVANGRLTWRRRVAGSGIGLWRRWGRFHLARRASLLLCIGLFPIVAPWTGSSIAYWSLLVVGSVVNFCSDKYWSFSAGARLRPRHAADRTVASRRLRWLPLAAVPAGLLAVVFTDTFILVVSVFMIVVAATTLAFQLYKWWRPDHNDSHRHGEPDTPRLPGVILVPMRHEEAVAGQTLERLAQLDHPDYWVVPIIDHPDDPGTAAIVHGKAREHPGRVLVCSYPEEAAVHNKPIGLNAAVEMLHELQIPFAWVGVADAEDLFHPDLLKLVDYRFRTTGAGIVQCGVQLMNFASDPDTLPLPSGRLARTRRWWKAHASAWWRVANVLEYFKWFQSRLKLQAAVRVMPLGGNTVFFRREFLETLHRRHGSYWDEDCLTEDCKIGILASVLGFKVDVVYIEELVTREETPATLAGFVRQRVRWMQGSSTSSSSGTGCGSPPSASGSWPSMSSASSSSRPPPGCWPRSPSPWPCSTRRPSCSRCWPRSRSPSAPSPSCWMWCCSPSSGRPSGSGCGCATTPVWCSVPIRSRWCCRWPRSGRRPGS
jgi:glycosyltransferase XagB